MIFASATRAFADVFSPGIRSVFWKVLGLTALALVALWFALRESFILWVWPWIAPWVPSLPDWAGWISIVAGLMSAIGLAAGLALLIAPISAVIAGLFLDDVADVIEARDYPSDMPGKALPLGQSVLSSLRFFAVVVLANLVALLFLLLPGVNLVAFFLVNGYLLGREFFEFAASALSRARAGASLAARIIRARSWLAGLLIALFLAVPIAQRADAAVCRHLDGASCQGADAPHRQAGIADASEHLRGSSTESARNVTGLFRRFAEIGDDAALAFRLARLAAVAPVQDQPVMGVEQVVLRNDLHQDCPRPRPASCPAQARCGWRCGRYACRPPCVGMPKAMDRTTLAVLRPTPGSVTSSSRVCAALRRRNRQ